jgi:hypothetical protein
MFASHEITLDASYDVVSGRMAHLINWGALHGVSEAVYEGGLEAIVRVGPFGGTRGLSKLVRVRALGPVHRHGTTRISLRWEATGLAGELFPVLDAELTLAPSAADRCRIELIGSYRAPLGRAGAALDRAFMGRIADATIRSLLERVATAVSDPVPESQTTLDAVPQWRPILEPEEP